MERQVLRIKARRLRARGFTYSEICQALNKQIPKGTMSGWCNGVYIKPNYRKKLAASYKRFNDKSREKALQTKRNLKTKRYEELVEKNQHLLSSLDTDTVKIMLAILYLGEGSKSIDAGQMVFGNSDPSIIKLYINCLRLVYEIDESKFRCTLQCRADQPILELEKFWSEVTGIPRAQFYKARIDPRSVGQVTKKKSYKGVLRLNYFSAYTLRDLLVASDILCKGP